MTRSRLILLLTIIVLAGVWMVVDRRQDICRRINLGALLEADLDGRLIPHRVNRLVVLDTVLERGIRSMEIDLLFRQNEGAGYFEVGHDEQDAKGVRFEQFLGRMRSLPIRKLWLDMKNLGPANVESARTELLRLDAAYGIRAIAIVECYSAAPEMRRLAEAGFHTSYYLPDSELDELIESSDPGRVSRYVTQLADQVERQGLMAISFRLAYHSFVKQQLEPKLRPGLSYHAWDSVRLGDWGAIDELRSSSYFADPKLVTIIYKL